MATKAGTLRRLVEAAASASMSLTVLVGCLAAGYLFAAFAAPARGTKMLPWLAGRALGLAGYACLFVLVIVGTWIRHPWRFRWPLLHPEVRLRLHASLSAASILLIFGHLSSLALDRYAGVGWRGALVPGSSHYRTVPVAMGVVAFEAMVLIGATAGLAGRFGGGRWLVVHRLATPVFVLVWLHGVLAGTDTPSLRLMYAVTGVVSVALLATRYLADPAPARDTARHRPVAGVRS